MGFFNWIKSLFTITPRYPERTAEELACKFGTDYKKMSQWVSKNIWWVEDKGRSDEWKLARQTLAEAKGDCEDFAVLVNTLLLYMGYEGRHIIVVYPRRGVGHCVNVLERDGGWAIFDNGVLRLPTRRTSLDAIAKYIANDRGWANSHWVETDSLGIPF